MKTKAFFIPIILLLNDVVISIPRPGMLILQPDLTFESIRILGFTFSGAVRFVGIPLLILVIFDSVILHRARKEILSFLAPMIGLLCILIFQFFVIPKDAVPMHSTGAVRYVSWALGYIGLLSTLNHKNSLQVLHIFTTAITILFTLLIFQYPAIIANSGYSLTAAIQLYGQNIIKMNGIFAAANEDANGAMTLLPFFLAYTEQQTGIKKWFFRTFALVISPLMIFFNGTRTALFFIYPLVLLLFYSNLSLKRLLTLFPLIAIAGVILRSVGTTFAEKAFNEESQGGGTSAWRIEHVWTPTFNYGSDISPVWGFGVRGWEYVCQQSGIWGETGSGESPHNIYLWIFISWGLVGLIIHFLFLLILLFHSFRLVEFPGHEISIYAKASFCSLSAYLVWASISNANIDICWLILIMIASSIAALSVSAHFQKHQRLTTHSMFQSGSFHELS
jgi:O-Antigen ligase